MRGRWAVEWNAGHAADDAREKLIAVGQNPCRCGGAGAIWRVAEWTELQGFRVGAVLVPVDPHSVDPRHGCIELPRPDVAHHAP